MGCGEENCLLSRSAYLRNKLGIVLEQVHLGRP